MTHIPSHDDLQIAYADLERENQKLADELHYLYRKMEEGTLHVIWCNGNHEKRVGADGMICNCPLGQDIRHWRHRARHAEDRLRHYGIWPKEQG